MTMRHPRPPRFADALAGKLAPREHAALEAHVATCARCARVRDRVRAARLALKKIGETIPPTSGWDLPRLHTTPARPRRRLWRLLPIPILACAAVALIFTLRPSPQPAARAPVAVAPAPAPAPASPAPPAPFALGNVVTFLQGDVLLGAAKATPDSSLSAGSVLETRRGRVAVQFGAHSGLVLEPQSKLEVVSFDSREIVLSVSGAVDVELESRLPGQRFALLAGERTVEVRGTVFRVAHHGGELDVAVQRGRVAVIEGGAQVTVDAGARLALGRGVAVGTLLPEPLLAEASKALADSMRVPIVAGWTTAGAAALRTSSPVLSVSAAPSARVRVDGVEAGSGSFLLRAPPGRHLVESGAAARWIDVDAGAASVTLADAARSERPGQVDAQLRVHRSDVGFCSDSERKEAPGFEGRVEVEIGIGADGAVNFVAPVRASATPQVDACIQDLIRDRFTFPRGTQATVRKVINF